MKRGTTNYNFLLGINKPSGITSHDCVNRVRGVFGEGRVGHMGTLDPFASGVLIVGVGPAARLNTFIENHNKTYTVSAVFGVTTDTYDKEGQYTNFNYINKCLYDKNFANDTINKLVGVHIQTPPAYSAIKINGVASYKKAREGKNVDLPKREIHVYEAEFLDFDQWDSGNLGDECSGNIVWNFRVKVSKGTYIRSLVNDLGQQLGCGAFVGGLIREQVGKIHINDCINIEDLENTSNEYTLLNAKELLGFDSVELDEESIDNIKNGNDIVLIDDKNEIKSYVMLTYNQDIIAIGKKVDEIKISPKLVFNNPLISFDSWKICPLLKNSVVTFGVFDGVHAGHKYIIDEAMKDAREKGVKAGIITFDIDPDEKFVNDFKKILSNEKRLNMLESSGVDFLKILNFDDVVDLDPVEFLDKIFADFQQIPKTIHVGKNFYFGKSGKGNVDTLKIWGKQHNMNVEIHELLKKDGKVISSTNIRRCII